MAERIVDMIQCNYHEGRRCPHEATHKLVINSSASKTTTASVEIFSCNHHRVATANAVAERFGKATRVELPRERKAVS